MKLGFLPATALLIAGALFIGCSDKHADDGHDHGAEDKGAQHGEAGAVPGSYEDWCAEHAVPESKCTRCDPSLVAAFKATSDWCAEHGMPESQCLKCNPDLKIERPPNPAGGQK
jgi:hypothetical protein